MSRYVKPSQLKIGDRIVTNERDAVVWAVSNDYDANTNEHLGVRVSLSAPLRYMSMSIDGAPNARRGLLMVEGAPLTDNSGYDIYVR